MDTMPTAQCVRVGTVGRKEIIEFSPQCTKDRNEYCSAVQEHTMSE